VGILFEAETISSKIFLRKIGRSVGGTFRMTAAFGGLIDGVPFKSARELCLSTFCEESQGAKPEIRNQKPESNGKLE
jgi:hypothetical protein